MTRPADATSGAGLAPLPPTSTIGILGGGQLGRMLALAAARLGFDTCILTPEEGAPASRVAACWQAKNVPFTLTSKMRSYSASVTSLTGLINMIPALFTRMSSFPK